MSFLDLIGRNAGYHKLRAPSPRQGTGPTALNLRDPIQTESLAETQASVQKRAQGVADAAVQRGEAPDARTLAAATGEITAPNPIEAAFNALTMPMDVIRLGVLQALPGGLSPSDQDFSDVMTGNKQRMIARHQIEDGAKPHTEDTWGRTGEYRGTDQLEDLGWDYAPTDQAGPLDELQGFARGVTAGVFDVFQDPMSLVTGGGQGVARRVAVSTAENITTKATIQAVDLLGTYGDDALNVVIKDVAEEGTSPLVVHAAEQMQNKGRLLASREGWGSDVQGVIREVSGVKAPEGAVEGVIHDMAQVGGEAVEEAAEKGVSSVDNIVPRVKDVLGESTVWADMNGEIAETVARKQFYRRGELWDAYSQHVIHHTTGDPAALSSIGGLSYQVPFAPRSARSFGDVTTKTRGLVTRLTRSEKLGDPFGAVGQSKPVMRARTWWQNFRNTAGREQQVTALKSNLLSPEARRMRYLQLVIEDYGESVVANTLNPIAVTVVTSNVGQQIRNAVEVMASGDDNARTIAMQRVLKAYGQGAEDITAETFADIPNFSIDENAVAAIDQRVKTIWKLQEAGSHAYARFDAEFKKMWENSNRTHVSMVVHPEVGEAILANRGSFDTLFDELDAWVSDPKRAKQSMSDRIYSFAEDLGARNGMELSDNEFIQFYDFINGYKAVKQSPGLQALGESAVVRLRKSGASAYLQLEKQGSGWKLRTVQDWTELAELNSKYTKLLNAYLPSHAQLGDVIETNPAAILEHWMAQIHSAVSERMMTKLMYDSGVIVDPKIKALNLDEWLLRQVRTGATEDAFSTVEEMMNVLVRVANDEVPEAQVRRVLANQKIDHMNIDIGGITIPVQKAMYYDTGFRQAVNSAKAYLDSLVEPSMRNRIAKRLAQTIGKIQDSGKTTGEIHKELYRSMSSRYRSHRSSMFRAMKDNIELQYSMMEEAAIVAGRPPDEIEMLLAKKAEELAQIDIELGKLDLAHSQLAERTTKEAMAGAPNAKTKAHAADARPSKKSKHDPASVSVPFRTVEDFDKVFDEVAEHRLSRIKALTELRDALTPEERPLAGAELTELRRIAEGTEYEFIPMHLVERSAEDVVWDSGWAIPEPHQANVWIEYIPGFGGGGTDYRPGAKKNIRAVYPEGQKWGVPAEEFAKQMGWTGHGQTIEEWWETSFVRIGAGVFKYVGDQAPMPFYVLATPASIEDSVLRTELSQIWHNKNHAVPEGYDLEGLEVYGLQALGLNTTAEMGVSEEIASAIQRIRARKPGSPKGVRGPNERRRFIPVFEFYQEYLHQRAMTMVKENPEMSIPEAMEALRGSELMADWTQAYHSFISKKPGFHRRLETAGKPRWAFDPMDPKPPPKGTAEGDRILRPSRGVDAVHGYEYLDESKIVERVFDVPSPKAHRFNQHMAKTNGVEGWEEMGPEDLEHHLRFLDLDPLPTFEREVGQFLPSYSTEASRSAGGRFQYDDGYLEWLQGTANDMGITTYQPVRTVTQPPVDQVTGAVLGEPVVREYEAPRELSGLAIDHPAIWELEARVEEVLNTPIDRILGGAVPVGYEQIPHLSRDLENMINKAYAQVFGRSEQAIDPFIKMMRLRGRGWEPKAADVMAWHEDIPEFRIGESPGVTDRIMDFLSDERMENVRVELLERIPVMEEAYRTVAGQYRAHGSPTLADDSEFWDWIEAEVPGIMERLRGIGGTAASVRLKAQTNLAHEAGVRLLELERRFALGPPPPRGRASQAMAAYNEKAAAFKSGFSSGTDASPEAAWKNFYDKVIGQDVHPAFVGLVQQYEKDMAEIASPELLEADIIAEVLNMKVLPEDSVGEDLTYTLVSILNENEGDLRSAIALADPVKGADNRANDMVMTQDDWDALTDEDLGPIGQEMKRLRDQSWLSRFDEESSRVEDYLDGVGVDADADDFRPATGDVIRRGQTMGAGMKSRPKSLWDVVIGDSFVNIDELGIGEYDHRFFTQYYEPVGSVSEQGINYETIKAVDVSQGSNLPSMDVPRDPVTGEILRDSKTGERIAFRETGAGGHGPTGMDETMADEFGEPQRIELDPRRSQEQIDEPWSGKIVVPTRKGTGDRVNLKFGEAAGSEETVIRFQEHQAQIEEAMRNLRFPDTPLDVAARHHLSDELIAEGDSLFDVLLSTDNRWHRHGLAVAGVDIEQAEEAWHAFKASKHQSFLEDADLKNAFAYAKRVMEIETVAKGTDKQLAAEAKRELRAREKAVDRARLDLPIKQTAPARHSVRKILDAEYKSLRGDEEILTRAEAIRGTTEAAGVSGQTFKELEAMQRRARRREYMIGNRPAPVEQAYDPWPQMQEISFEDELVIAEAAPVVADLGGQRLASTNLKTGKIRIDEEAIARDYEAGLPYLAGQVGPNSKMKAQILEELGTTPEELHARFEAEGGVEAYRDFILRHEQFHVRTGRGVDYDSELEATREALEGPQPPAVTGPGVTRVISGGQKGADHLGLVAGADLGLETGGTAPKTWATSQGGPGPDELQAFGLVEDDSMVQTLADGSIDIADAYRQRTLKNVSNSDGTIILTVPGRFDSPGSQLTRSYARSAKKPFLDNPTPAEVRRWVEENNIKTLNIAGNREYEDIEYIKALLKAASGKDSDSGLAYVGSVGRSQYGTEVVNLKKGQKADVNIMRATSGGADNGLWGNRFTHLEHLAQHPDMTLVPTVQDAVVAFEKDLKARIASGEITMEKLASLSGKSLGCVDAPGPCHGDVLARYADEAARELGLTKESIPGAVNVGRHGGQTDNWGNPFYVMGEKDARRRWANKLHPFYKRRIIEQGDWVDVVEEGPRRTTVPGQPSVRWEAVPYTAVKTQAEADQRYYEMLWDMIDDEEFGPDVRRQLVEQLHGRVLFKYATGSADFANSKAFDARILADAVDWIESGVYDSTRQMNFKGVGPRRTSGRPTRNNLNPYSTPQETKILERIETTLDKRGVEEMYDRYKATLAPTQAKELSLQEERLVQQLIDHPEYIDFILDPQAKPAYYRAVNQAEYGAEVKALADTMIPFFERMGIEEYDEMLTNFDQAWRATEQSPIMTVVTQAARRAAGPRAQFEYLPEGGLNLVVPGSDQNDWLAQFNTTEVRAAKGLVGSGDTPLSATFKDLDEMGEQTAKEKGMAMAYELSQASASLRNKRDMLLNEIDRVKKDMADAPTKEALEAGTRAERELIELEEDINLVHKVLDLGWSASITKENAALRKRFKMRNQAGDLPSGDEWDAFQRALDQFSPQHRHNVEFIVYSGLAADLFDDFDTFKNWWFTERTVTMKTSKAINEMLSQLYREAEAEPLLWHQVISMNGIDHKVRQAFLEAMQIAKMHQEKHGDDRYIKLLHRIGLETRKSLDDRFGASAVGYSERGTGVEVIESFMETMSEIRQAAPMQLLSDLGMIDKKVFTQIENMIESFKIRREEFVAFQRGVPGDYMGLAGAIEQGFMDEVVEMEFSRALGRLQLASDPRHGMEIMAGVSAIKKWWTKAATVGRPTFSLRNLIGGLWNNKLDGVGVHETLAMMPDVLQYVKNRRRLGDVEMWDIDIEEMIDGYLLRGVSDENKEVMGRAIRAGIMDNAFSSTLPRNVKGAYGMRAWNPFNSDNKYFTWGTEAMEFTEGILRMAVFKHYYDSAFPHMSSRQGKVMVDMLHFDYSDMSNFDKKMKTIAPFWIWTSRNLPLQMRHMLGDPRMLLRYEHVRRNMNDQFKDWDDENGEWQTAGGRWVLPFRREDDKGNWVQLSWEPALPFNDLLATPLFQQTFDDEGYDLVGEGAFNAGRWVGWVTGNLAPELSALHELVVDPRDQWRQTNAPPVLAPIFRALNFGEETPQGDVRIQPWINSALQTMLPFFNEYVSIAGMPSTSPYSAGNQGFLPEEYLNRGALDARVPVQQMARGLGFHWRSPEDIYWTYKDIEAYLEQEQFMERSARS